MIIGLGIDLVETKRVVRELGGGPWRPRDGVFTEAEISYCNRGRQPERRYAACFAAKEATLKALGADVADLGIFREAEVRLDGGGDCRVLLGNRLRAVAGKLGARHINLSVAVQKERVVAMVILES